MILIYLYSDLRAKWPQHKLHEMTLLNLVENLLERHELYSAALTAIIDDTQEFGFGLPSPRITRDHKVTVLKNRHGLTGVVNYEEIVKELGIEHVLYPLTAEDAVATLVDSEPNEFIANWKVDEVIECLLFGDNRYRVEHALFEAMPDAYKPNEEMKGVDIENLSPGDITEHSRLLSKIWKELPFEVRKIINAAARRKFDK